MYFYFILLLLSDFELRAACLTKQDTLRLNLSQLWDILWTKQQTSTVFYFYLMSQNETFLRILDILWSKQETEKTVSSLTRNTNKPHMRLGWNKSRTHSQTTICSARSTNLQSFHWRSFSRFCWQSPPAPEVTEENPSVPFFPRSIF